MSVIVIRRLLLVVLSLLLSHAFGAYALAAVGKHMLWKVTQGDQTAYLFGSVHFGVQTMYPLDQIVLDAYAASDALVVEIDVTAMDPLQAAQLMLVKGMYPDNVNNLKANVSDSTWTLLNQTAQRFNLPIEFIQQQKPWLAALILSAHAFKQAGFKEELGIDFHFLNKARDRKDIIELETAEQQLSIFDGLSPQEQEEMLVQTLQDLQSVDEYVATLLRAWQTGDTAALDQLMNESLKNNATTERAYQLLLTDRNVTMSAKISEIMRSGRVPFVVVGAGHMVGADSIVQLLIDHGYSVEQL